MTLRTSITMRRRRRKQRSGVIIVQVRWVLSYRDPRTRKRVQRFFARKEEALAARDQLILNVAAGSLPSAKRANLTVKDVVEHWLEARRGEIKESTLDGYRRYTRYAVGPMPAVDRLRKTPLKGQRSTVGLLGPVLVSELTTADIRKWFQGVATTVGRYTASAAKMYLRAALNLAAEDFSIRPPAMPSGLGRNQHKPKKAVLTLDQIAQLLAAAQQDERGIYYAFGFLSGARPGEQLGLLWLDVDFDADLIHVRRSQALDGSLNEITKTAAGMRSVPMAPLLRRMLLEWKPRCPRAEGQPHRVFPATLGGPFHHPSYLQRVWHPALAKAGVPYVSPHSARHSWISALQMAGTEVAVAARLAGHANPAITLKHYSHPLHDGRRGVAALEAIYKAGNIVAA